MRTVSRKHYSLALTDNQQFKTQFTLKTLSMASAALLSTDGTMDLGSWLSDGNVSTQPTGLFVSDDQSRAVPLRNRRALMIALCTILRFSIRGVQSDASAIERHVRRI